MTNDAKIAQKVFCSYSWSSQEYERKILSIAEQLMQAGIEVLLDKWDLAEGADIHAYMEQSVTDKSVTKVLIFCDSAYAEKANDRSGGVGKETLIITGDFYNQTDVTSKEQRYLPIVMEKDGDGQACLPAYLQGRYYVDMSEEDLEIENFEQLVRAIYEQPLHRKPALGKTPDYILSKTEVRTTGLNVYQKKAIVAVQNHKPHAMLLCQSYFNHFLEKLEIFRFDDSDKNNELSTLIVNKIKSMSLLKSECLDLIFCALKRSGTNYFGEILHSFFEKIYDFTQCPEEITYWDTTWSDHYKFLLYELFLNSCAFSLKNGTYEVVECLFEEYYCRSKLHESRMKSFYTLDMHVQSFGDSQKKQAVEVLQNAKENPSIASDDIMQADFLLFLRSRFNNESSFAWYPATLATIAGREFPFEIFVRAKSKAKCDNLFNLLGIKSKQDIEELVCHDEWVKSMKFNGYLPLDVKKLCNFSLLATTA